jgi:hypothetical protein
MNRFTFTTSFERTEDEPRRARLRGCISVRHLSTAISVRWSNRMTGGVPEFGANHRETTNHAARPLTDSLCG